MRNARYRNHQKNHKFAIKGKIGYDTDEKFWIKAGGKCFAAMASMRQENGSKKGVTYVSLIMKSQKRRNTTLISSIGDPIAERLGKQRSDQTEIHGPKFRRLRTDSVFCRKPLFWKYAGLIRAKKEINLLIGRGPRDKKKKLYRDRMGAWKKNMHPGQKKTTKIKQNRMWNQFQEMSDRSTQPLLWPDSF